MNSLSEKTNLSHFPEVRAAIRRRAGDDWDETPAPEEAHCYRPRTHFRRVHKQMLLDDIGWTPQSRGVQENSQRGIGWEGNGDGFGWQFLALPFFQHFISTTPGGGGNVAKKIALVILSSTSQRQPLMTSVKTREAGRLISCRARLVMWPSQIPSAAREKRQAPVAWSRTIE